MLPVACLRVIVEHQSSGTAHDVSDRIRALDEF